METIPALHPLCVLPPEARAAAMKAYFDGPLQAALPHEMVGSAVVSWQRLPWDTRLLGMETARLNYILGPDVAARREGLEHILASARAAGVRYLVARIDAADRPLLHALEERGFITVDGLLTFARELVDLDEAAIGFRSAGIDDVARLRDLGSRLFRQGRFHGDPAIDPARADAIYAEWLDNSVQGGMADFVLVHEADGTVQGFVTARVEASYAPWLGGSLGVIVLVGTAPEAGRRGIASGLTRACLAEMRRRGARFAQVGTQLNNVPAARTYEACGFRLVATSLTLRRLEDPARSV